MANIQYYSIVLDKKKSSPESPVEDLIAEVFAIDQDIAKEITTSLPITILENLEDTQLRNILAELAPFSEAGLVLSAIEGIDTDIPKITWPEPPVINGKSLLSYGIENKSSERDLTLEEKEFQSVCCPECGTKLNIKMQKNTPSNDSNSEKPQADNTQTAEQIEKYNIFVVNDQSHNLKDKIKKLLDKDIDKNLLDNSLQKKHIAIEKGVDRKKAIKIQREIKGLSLTPRITKAKN